MSYRSLHKTNEWFELTAMFVLIAAFLLALALMFVHPTGSLIVFFLGLAFFGAAVVIEFMFRRAERAAARVELSRRECPSCGAHVHRENSEGHDEETEWRCDACGAVFSDTGDRRMTMSAQA